MSTIFANRSLRRCLLPTLTFTEPMGPKLHRSASYTYRWSVPLQECHPLSTERHRRSTRRVARSGAYGVRCLFRISPTIPTREQLVGGLIHFPRSVTHSMRCIVAETHSVGFAHTDRRAVLYAIRNTESGDSLGKLCRASVREPTLTVRSVPRALSTLR